WLRCNRERTSCIRCVPEVANDERVKLILADQSTFAPERLTTSAHFAYSLRMNSPNCSGDPLAGSEPIIANFSLSDGVAITLLISAFRRAMISFGTPAGATIPVHVVAS